MEDNAKIIALVDMDCFYVQVEERDNPSIKNIPAAVVQYKLWQGGGIIAVNYEARAKGVTRSMRGDTARQQCPEIVLVKVPETNGKADLSKYRDAGKEVVDVICTFSDIIVERASIDEVYIDLTEAVNIECAKKGLNPFNEPLACLDALDQEPLECCFPVGYGSMDAWISTLKGSDIISVNDVRLAVGAEIVGRMRKAVFETTGFRCSAGIAHNKVLAKLGAGLNKPNKQTVIPHSALMDLYSQTKIRKVRMLGGQIGDVVVEHFKIEKMSELQQISLNQFAALLGQEKAQWLYDLARGYDNEPVCKRELAQSIGCSKNFRGPEMLTSLDMCKDWIRKLADEVVGRLQKDSELNNRKAKTLTLHVKFLGQKHLSRVCGHGVPNDAEKITSSAMALLAKIQQETRGKKVVNLGLIASKLEEETTCRKITSFCKVAKAVTLTSAISDKVDTKVTEVDIAMKPNVQSLVKLAKNSSESSDESVDVTKGDTTEESDIEVDIESVTPNPVQKKIRRKSSGQGQTTPRIKANVQPLCLPLQDSQSDHTTPTKQKTYGILPSETTPRSKLNQPLFVSAKSPPKKLQLNDPVSGIVSTLLPLPSEQLNLNPSVVQSSTKMKSSEIKDSDHMEQHNKLVQSEPHNIPENILDYDNQGLLASGFISPSDFENSEKSEVYLQTCPRCNAQVPMWDFMSHEDYHIAAELQRQLDQDQAESRRLISAATSSTSHPSPAKKAGKNAFGKRPAEKEYPGPSGRGRGSSSKRGRPHKQKSEPVKTKTLDSYFTPK